MYTHIFMPNFYFKVVQKSRMSLKKLLKVPLKI